MMPCSHFRRQLLLAVTIILCVASSTNIQAQASKSTLNYDTTLYNKMQWRDIGPFRGGRSIAVAGHRDQPYTYYFGATGGGIWKTEDGGDTWLNVSDGFPKVGIVGALAIAESDPNVIYAGTGESCIRGNAMPGEGMDKSVDAGKTWSMTSGGPGSGLWKSTDGGDTWTDLSTNRGMPKGVKRKICVAASGAKADLV